MDHRALPIMIAALSLAACAQRSAEGADNALMNADAVVALSPGTQPVTIGETGSGFAACATRATVAAVPDGATTLPVRAAPFDEAKAIGGIAAGAQAFVCTRSMDQRWLGVVVPTAGAPPGCGVDRPVSGERAYAGPCQSGWVASGYLRLSAG